MLFFPSRIAQTLILTALLTLPLTASAGESRNYSPAERALKVVRLDTSPDASFVSVRADAGGRLFVGGRESLFVYEPDGKGGYRPRHELYRFPPHSWVFDIEIRGNDLYVMTASALYLLPGAVRRREGLEAKRLIWGQPLGHLQLGFFGLAWGPEGDLYFSMGDPLQHYGDFNRPDHWGHWTFFSQPEGTRTPYTGVGGVLRCRPDGSRLQVVSRGIFRPCGLAFDRYWNLFTDDNDREAMPVQYVPARLLHVTPHSYFSWPRGWMAAKSPDRADLLEILYGGLGREAPVGLAYYDETFLGSKYRNNLLMAGWARRVVNRYPLKPRGASFTTEEHSLLIGRQQARPVGICVGRGGRVFVVILQMPQLEGSPTCPSDLVMITTADDDSSRPFAAYDAPSVPAEKLWTELSQASWSRRHRAHTEILRRGGALLTEATKRLATVGQAFQPAGTDRQAGKPAPHTPAGKPARHSQAGKPARHSQAGKLARHLSDPAIYHLPWLAAAGGSPEAGRRLADLASHPNANVRLQAIRALAEFFPSDKTRPVLARALSDANPQVRHAALSAFFDEDDWPPEAAKPLSEELLQQIVAQARSEDTYIRQAACLLLAERAPLDSLRKLAQADDAAIRLAGVLAAGFRLTLPPATKPLPEHVPLEPFREAACVVPFADAKIDLRKLGRLGKFTFAEHWKAGKDTPEQEKLFALLVASLSDQHERTRLQAAYFLQLLNDPRSEPLLAKVIADSEERRLAAVPVSDIKTIRAVWLIGPFPDGRAGLEKAHRIESGPIDLAGKYPLANAQLAWKREKGRYFNLTKLLGASDHSSSYAYCRLVSPRRQRILLFVGSNDGVKVWHNGRLVWKNEVVRRALAFQDSLILDLQPGSNELLVRVHNVTGESGMYLSYKSLGLVVATLPEKLGLATLADRIRAAAKAAAAGGGSAGQKTIPPEFLKVDWRQAVSTGDPQRGEKLFGEDALGCVKCHAITAEQAGAGAPSLAEAAKRFTIPHLVESILLPNSNISPVFRATLVVTNAGKQFTGLVVGETAENLELLLSDASRKKIAKGDIEVRKLVDVSPMPQGIVKTPEELRDLLSYLMKSPGS